MKNENKEISNRIVERLTEYLMILREFRKYNEKINSVELAEIMKTTSAQVRKDLSTFGEFGVRGKGYSIDSLVEIIENILGIDEENKIILVGHGKMGSMIASNNDVLGKGFKIVGVFDKNPEIIGEEIKELNLKVKNSSEMKEFIEENKIDTAILAVTSEKAQLVGDELVKYGIKAILNMTAYKLELANEISIVSVDVSARLQELNFWRKNSINSKGGF